MAEGNLRHKRLALLLHFQVNHLRFKSIRKSLEFLMKVIKILTLTVKAIHIKRNSCLVQALLKIVELSNSLIKLDQLG